MSKGKVFVALIAVLALPAVGFGQWGASLDLTSGGSSSIIVDKPGESFSLEVGLSSDQVVGGVQYALDVMRVSGGNANAAFEGSFNGGDLASFGSLFSPPFPVDNNLFALADASSKMAAGPVSLAGLDPELIFRGAPGNVGDIDPGVLPGSLLNYTLTALAPGDYTIGITNAILTNSLGQKGSTQPDFSSLSVHVTPEPASALLLLTAVPFLRRRRA